MGPSYIQETYILENQVTRQREHKMQGEDENRGFHKKSNYEVQILTKHKLSYSDAVTLALTICREHVLKNPLMR